MKVGITALSMIPKNLKFAYGIIRPKSMAIGTFADTITKIDTVSSALWGPARRLRVLEYQSNDDRTLNQPVIMLFAMVNLPSQFRPLALFLLVTEKAKQTLFRAQCDLTIEWCERAIASLILRSGFPEKIEG